MRRTETPVPVEASSPAAKLDRAVFSATASKLGEYCNTIQAVRTRMKTAEPRVTAPLKDRTAPVVVSWLSVSWTPGAAASAAGGAAAALVLVAAAGVAGAAGAV